MSLRNQGAEKTGLDKKAFQLAIPTAEHYLPLMHFLVMQAPDERVSLFNDHAMAGSLTMTSVVLGL